MIRITLYDHGQPFLEFTDEAGMADAYARYAQLNGYGVEMEAIDVQ